MSGRTEFTHGDTTYTVDNTPGRMSVKSVTNWEVPSGATIDQLKGALSSYIAKSLHAATMAEAVRLGEVAPAPRVQIRPETLERMREETAR